MKKDADGRLLAPQSLKGDGKARTQERCLARLGVSPLPCRCCVAVPRRTCRYGSRVAAFGGHAPILYRNATILPRRYAVVHRQTGAQHDLLECQPGQHQQFKSLSDVRISLSAGG
jgi:hypothetical protein